ncbi:hypothetical protein F511_31882 [Dorcoceras hygrometricum]|uniref:Uncharacterized protein n=1 Tax=Dorcoceras hygrometricum TaxID=472368 RepID=A0A2Z7AGS2_9LAMI|nr:hypothetical protein F511_31882 [Dorcoceras hygrometricum]
MRKDMHDHKTALSLDVVKSQQRISTQVAATAFDNVNVRKEVKELSAKVTDLDGQVATIRSELLDFRAHAEENHIHLSSQLCFLVDYINRVVMPKRGKVVAAALNHLRMTKKDPVVVVRAEVTVAVMEVKEEVTEVDPPRKGIVALVVVV